MSEPGGGFGQAGAGRYRVEQRLGQGGMAIVHRALDSATGRAVALKRLRVDRSDAKREQIVALFQREYLTLAQLAHPRIVQVYDYGVDEDGPYYTMELLDGGDLQGLSPVPWQRACKLARDVCSALALLHSRRMVYRDLSPRNVRCTNDGLAKLIDFGAMTLMGASRELVGTLPFVAPEALHQQPLDARTDLYALGATLYFALLQRHAYPARDVAQLRDFWRSRPRRPSELVAEIPEALDCLVMDLMHLDAAVRPTSAAEVMERLGAIAGLRASEQTLVSQAYLSNPSLVGRDAEVATVRRLAFRALRGRGAGVLLRGQAGSGRSRLLDACVLEAKLAGLLVLRAGAADAQGGDYDLVRALAGQLLRAEPGLTRAAAEEHIVELGWVIPELLEDRSERPSEAMPDAEQLHRRVQPALRHWLLAISQRRPMLIAIDDLARGDGPSVALVSLLAQEVSARGILLVGTEPLEHEEGGHAREALDLFANASVALDLEALTPAATEELLGSVFGDAPNVGLLAQHVHRITAGNPRDIMRLSQHLVTEGMVRYRAGSWSLPSSLDASELPSTMADALRTRVDKLNEAARTLAQALSFEPAERFAFDECAALSPHASSVRVLQLLDELVAEEVLLRVGERYTLGERGWAAPLARTMSQQQRSVLHLRLAEVYERRGDGFRKAQHLLKGGELERGLDVLLEAVALSEQQTDLSPQAFFVLLQSLPPDWLSTYELGLSLCAEQKRPAKQCDVLLSRLAGLLAHSVADRDRYEHVQRRLDALSRACGLDLFAALPESLPFAERLKGALEAAHARFLGLPEDERVFEPSAGIRRLLNTELAALGTISFSLDYEAWRKLPSLAPLAPLSPGIGLVEQLRLGVGARITARTELAISVYEALLERTSKPDRAGLEPAAHFITELRIKLGIGTLEAAMGRSSSLERARELESEPVFETQGLRIRYLYHLWQGDTREAARCKRQNELRQVESAVHHGPEGQHLLSELCAHALADDLTRVKASTDAVEQRARVHRAWLPVLYYGRGEYHRIRGDHSSALEQLEAALSLAQAGTHQAWPNIAGAHLRTLFELERYEELRTAADLYLAAAETNGLGYVRAYLRLPRCLALSKLGEHAQAVVLADGVIEELLSLQVSGLLLAAAYETRARLDLDVDDRESFERHAELCAAQCRSGEKRLLGAKYRRAEEASDLMERERDELQNISQFTSTLENCQTAAQRAQCGLEYLGRHSNALAGLLYLYSKGSGLVRTARFGDVEDDPALEQWIAAYFVRELDEEESTDVFSGPPGSAPEQKIVGGRRCVPVLLSHQTERGPAITGIAVLFTVPGDSFVYPSRVAAELSRTVEGAGDVTAVYS